MGFRCRRVPAPIMARLDEGIVAGILFFILIAVSTLFARGIGEAENSLEEIETADLSYGIIMDAGSSGTRLFLYKWGPTPENTLMKLEPVLDKEGQPVVKKAKPGLSSFADHPEDAADYIKPLLDYAVEYVPIKKRLQTPVFLFATAGMRLLEESEQSAILANLHHRLPLMTPLSVEPENIKVIEGKWEGIYSWVAVNYILGRFNKSATHKETVGMIDMGGASTQIAFELPKDSDFYSDSNLQEINLGVSSSDQSFKFRVFVTTFLGYGANEGMARYESELAEHLHETNTYGKTGEPNVELTRDHCLPDGLQMSTITEHGDNMTRVGTGQWDSCVEELSKLISEGELSHREGAGADPCKDGCFFGAVPAPKVDLSAMPFYGFSEYWYSIHDVLGLDAGTFNYSTVRERSINYCSKKWTEVQHSASILYPKADEERLKTQCFKSAWISAALFSGYNINKNNHRFQSAFTIEGQEVQWALGAMLYNMRFNTTRPGEGTKIIEPSPTFSSSMLTVVEMFFVLLCLVTIVYTFLSWRRSMRPSSSRPSTSLYMPLKDQEREFMARIY